MNRNEAEKSPSEFNRRDFLRTTSSFGAMMALMGGVPLRAEDKPAADSGTHYSTVSAPVSCGVIGCGLWGREILQNLAQLPNAPVVAVCDTYEPFLRKGKAAAPKAEGYTDYHKLLGQKEVEAVIVATPSHQHRDVVLAALAAGKHVYCEAPLATTLEDARAIAQAAKAAFKLNFQSGLQVRSDPQKLFLLPFIRSGAIGKAVMARSQWHKKQSWRRTSPNPERERETNWRLSNKNSGGLIAEIGIHQLDLISWILNARPQAVSGFGGILNWNDGRDVADTIQSIFEYPEGVNFFFDCSLANSFDSDYDIIYGSDAAVMLRGTADIQGQEYHGSKAWMFKEVDSSLLGWEVYARKDVFYQETGIALVANATKLTAQKGAANDEAADTETPLHYALDSFIRNCHVVASGVEDFTSTYGDDAAALRENLAALCKSKTWQPAANYQEGFEATVAAIKANEAITTGQKIVLQKEWFEI